MKEADFGQVINSYAQYREDIPVAFMGSFGCATEALQHKARAQSIYLTITRIVALKRARNISCTFL